MSPARVTRPRRRLFLLAAPLLIAVLAVGGWLALRGDDEPTDGLGGVRGLSAVDSASREDDEVDVALRPGAGRAAVADVLDRLPDETDGGTLRLGRATLEFDDRGELTTAPVGPFLAAAATRAPGGRIAFSRRSTGWSVETEVPRAAQAATLARELVGRIAPQGRYRDALGRLVVSIAGAPQAEVPPVTLRVLSGGDRRLAISVLDAAIDLAAREPRVSTNGTDGELHVRADGVADAGAAWRAATRALDARRADRGSLRLYVDEPDDDEGTGGRSPVVSGPADASPARALALLRALDGPATHAFVATDLQDAEADVPGPAAARAAATAARGAAPRTLAVRWPAAGAPAIPRSGSTDREPAVTSVDDTPAAILRLLPGVERARRAGILQLAWDRPPALDVARLQIAPPAWIDPDTRLPDEPATLRRLARAVRAVGWPGRARFDLPLGPGGCAGYPKAPASARIVSAADGRARSVDVAASCTIDGAAARVRRAWDAGAD